MVLPQHLYGVSPGTAATTYRYNMVVTAYSGVGNPNKLFTAVNLNVAFSGTNTTVRTLTVTETGILQGFSCIVNVVTVSALAGNAGTVTCRLARSGQTLASATLDVDSFDQQQDGGIIFSENLSFLAGTEILANEVFTLSIVCANVNNSITLDTMVSLSLGIRAKAFQI